MRLQIQGIEASNIRNYLPKSTQSREVNSSSSYINDYSIRDRLRMLNPTQNRERTDVNDFINDDNELMTISDGADK